MPCVVFFNVSLPHLLISMPWLGDFAPHVSVFKLFFTSYLFFLSLSVSYTLYISLRFNFCLCGVYCLVYSACPKASHFVAWGGQGGL